MDFGLTETQQMLKASAREFLQAECPKRFVRAMQQDARGFTPELWQKIAGLGWLRLPFPQAYGGDGQDFLTLCLLLEEMARVCLPGPYFSSTVLCGLTLAAFGSDSQKAAYLGGLGDGEIIMTLALLEPNVRYDTAAVQLEAIGHEANAILLDILERQYRIKIEIQDDPRLHREDFKLVSLNSFRDLVQELS